MSKDIRVKGKLRLYLQWPAMMILWLIAMNVWVWYTNQKAGVIMAICVLIYIAAVAIMYIYSKSKIVKELMELAADYGMVQNVLLKESSVPYVILAEDGKVLWKNDNFQKMVESTELPYLNKYFPELNRGVFPKGDNQTTEIEVSYQGKEYLVKFGRSSWGEAKNVSSFFGVTTRDDSFITASFFDVTELNAYMRESEGRKLVAGLIYIDNYEEVMESVEEVRQSLLVALIDRKINQYMSQYDAIVKKMEKDKYFCVVRKSFFSEMEENKFSVLEDVKTVNIGNTMPVTLSIGMGISAETYVQSYNFARVAIDLALARGGDQAVVKKGSDITYFGGKREQTAKNTRVKARVKAEALREFIMTRDQVIVMGHKIADVDSFGAAIGIYIAAKALGKKAYIVINEVTTSVRPFYEGFLDNPSYPDDLFIKNSDLAEVITDNTMAVVVDTSKAENTDCPELLKKAKTIVVFDHHRQSSTSIENTVLSYIEPYASSSCEMVAEVLQYITDDIKISAMEANCMYAGIIIDTNNFMNRTGVRTFEAAAFLRRCGVDITYVRKVFRDDLESYRAKAEIVGNAQIFCKEYAIAGYDNEEIESPTILGAQAANELLNIEGVKASFVLTKYNGKIYVSARSIDEVNVQLIMEYMGGGGHLNAAGAQFQHTDLKEAIATVKATVKEMKKKGDI